MSDSPHRVRHFIDRVSKSMKHHKREDDASIRIAPRLPPNPDFFGRSEELTTLNSRIVPRETPAEANSPQIYAVCGMGGVGKTELALEWFYNNASRFQSTFWIDASPKYRNVVNEPSNLAKNFAKIAHTLGICPEDKADDLVAARNIAKSWFAEATAPWLLVLDNAQEVDEVGSRLIDYWPTEGPGCILVTTRNNSIGAGQSSPVSRLVLEPFVEPEASDFVQMMAPGVPGKEKQQIHFDIAHELGGLPAAIVHMAASIDCSGYSLEKFLEHWQAGRQQADEPILERYGKALQDVLLWHTSLWTYNFSWYKSPDWENSALLLYWLSMLNADRIAEDLIVWPDNPKDVALYNPVRVIGSPTSPNRHRYGLFQYTRDKLSSATEQLLELSVIKRDQDTGELSIHPVYARLGRHFGSFDNLYDTFDDCCSALYLQLPFIVEPDTRQVARCWTKHEGILAHIGRLYKSYPRIAHARGDDLDGEHGNRRRPFYFPAARLFQQAGACLYERRDFRQAKLYLELALRAFTTSPEKPTDRQEVLSDIHYYLAAIAAETNDPKECCLHANAALEVRQTVCEMRGKGEMRLAAARNILAIGLATSLDRSMKANLAFDTTLGYLYWTMPDYEYDMAGFPEANFAWFSLDRGYTSKSFQTECLKRRAEVDGKGDKYSCATGFLLHSFGNVEMQEAYWFKQRGDNSRYETLMKECRTHHQEALAHLTSAAGAHPYRVANLRMSMAEYHIFAGEDEKAQATFDEALDIWGDDPFYKPQVARASFIKGQHLAKMGKEHSKESHRLIKKAKLLRREVLRAPSYEFLQESHDEYLDYDDEDGAVPEYRWDANPDVPPAKWWREPQRADYNYLVPFESRYTLLPSKVFIL